MLVVAADYVYLHDYTDADKWLTLATQWNPDDALGWYLLGRTKYNENRFQEATSAFRRCLQLDPRNVRAEDNLGLSYEGLADDARAQLAYKTAIQWGSELSHPDAQPYLNLGMLLAREGHDAQAIPSLEKAVELAPQNPKAREQLGRAYEKLHMLRKAQSELQQAILLAPGVSGLHFQLGRIYHEENNETMAKKEFAVCATLNGSKSTDTEETPNPDSPH
ncbi:MAG TPA: tetratricopeptide repeat protein [Acidobacteriaceae bacterium]|nr:tetratricopeptide repeat protein [Acidobacteriaceae bacterium]